MTIVRPAIVLDNAILQNDKAYCPLLPYLLISQSCFSIVIRQLFFFSFDFDVKIYTVHSVIRRTEMSAINDEHDSLLPARKNEKSEGSALLRQQKVQL